MILEHCDNFRATAGMNVIEGIAAKFEENVEIKHFYQMLVFDNFICKRQTIKQKLCNYTLQ